MSHNKKSPARRGERRNRAAANEKSYSNDTTKPTPIQDLTRQAETRMKSDPGRYGEHFLIWLSLNALKNGLRWPGVRDE